MKKNNWRHDHKNLAEGLVQQAVVLPPNFGGRVANLFFLKKKNGGSSRFGASNDSYVEKSCAH